MGSRNVPSYPNTLPSKIQMGDGEYIGLIKAVYLGRAFSDLAEILHDDRYKDDPDKALTG